MTLKKILFFLLCLLPVGGWGLNPNPFQPGSAPGKIAGPLLQRADSLFGQSQYAAAVPLYRTLVWRHGQASPQLLLRLAYAQQQQGHESAALLALSMAQARQPRLATWRQLAALAARQRLMGYPITWQQELRVQAQRYYYPGLQALLLAAVLTGVALLLRRRLMRRGAWLAYSGFLGLIGLYLHLLHPEAAGLVVRPGAALMGGPSAGAAWLSTTAVGDRLPVLARQDIWYRVRWQRRMAFIRSADLLVIEQ